MTTDICPDCGKVHAPPMGAICGPGPSYYIARVHRSGARTYDIVSRHRTKAAAIRAMAGAFARAGWGCNRADVLMVEKAPSYYDPIQLCELRRS